MNDRKDNRFEILRLIAVAGSKGLGLEENIRSAIRDAADYVGLSAAALLFFGEDNKVTTSYFHASQETDRKRLLDMEEELYSSLRREKKISSAHISFDTDPPVHSFTLPLRYRRKLFGAVIGLQEGERTALAEDVFLEAFAAVIALTCTAEGDPAEIGQRQEALQKERMAAIAETSVTVNHEVNNPLTAILGNVQLLLLKKADLDSDLVEKLQTIETSALRIRDVTQRLLRISNPRSIDYAEGKKMLDLSDEAIDETD